MIHPIRSLKAAVRTVVALLVAAGIGFVGYTVFRTSETIHDLLAEKEALKQAITNLTAEEAVGYAKVLKQEERDGRLYTRFLFVMTEPKDETKRILEKEFEVEGDVVFFDALIVKFDKKVVMDGREKALFLWRRVYSDKMTPESGFAVEVPGGEPARYAPLCARLSIAERATFWSEIWKLSDDPERLAKSGVRAIYGNVVYKQMRPGLIYRFKIDASGAFFPESYPDL
jgi:hypothetical protein